jgi:hypothetical protein
MVHGHGCAAVLISLFLLLSEIWDVTEKHICISKSKKSICSTFHVMVVYQVWVQGKVQWLQQQCCYDADIHTQTAHIWDLDILKYGTVHDYFCFWVQVWPPLQSHQAGGVTNWVLGVAHPEECTARVA